MTLCLGAACKLSYWSECLGKNVSAEPSTKDGIEAVRLCAFTPPGSSLDRHSVKVFPLTMNNASKFPLADSRCFLSFWFYGAPNQRPAQNIAQLLCHWENTN